MICIYDFTLSKMLFLKPVGNTAIESFLSNTFCIISFCSDLSCRWNCLSCRIRFISCMLLFTYCGIVMVCNSVYGAWCGSWTYRKTLGPARVCCGVIQVIAWYYRSSRVTDSLFTIECK